jgi:hypothetical protein
MPKLLLPLVAALAVGGTATAGGVYLATRDGGVEEVSRPPSVLDTPAPSPTVQEDETPAPSAAAPTPDLGEWPTYSDPGGRFTVRYPPTWVAKDGSLYSRDPEPWTDSTSPRPDMIEVEMGYYPDDGVSGCGALLFDSATGEVSPEAGATPTTLGGAAAWERVREPGDPAIEGNMTRIHAMSLIYKGYCIRFSAYFTQENPEVDTFLQIASTFEFEF